MSIFSGIVNYQNFEVESGITSNFFMSPTISANTISGGALSALYVASGKVTNQEFKYLSGTTSNIQIQINSLSNKNEQFVSYSASTNLDNDKSSIAGNAVTFSQGSKELLINTTLTSTEFVWINFNMTGISVTSITNWNPTGFQTDNNNRATHIILGGGSTSVFPSVISGLTGGTNGRIVIISNLATGFPVIFENNSSKCPTICKFNFSNDEAYFLSHNATMTLIYDGESQSWKEFYPLTRESMFSTYQDFNYVARNTNFGNGAYGRFYSSQGVIAYTGFNDTNSVISFRGTSTYTSPGLSASYCAGRVPQSLGGSLFTFFLSKVAIDNDFAGQMNFNNTVVVLNNGKVNSYALVCGAFGSAASSNQHWMISGNNWVNIATVTGTLAEVKNTNLLASDSVFNFVYLGIANNGTRCFWFYSKDGNEYEISNIRVQSSTNFAAGFGAGARTTLPTTITPTLFVDWYGMNLN